MQVLSKLNPFRYLAGRIFIWFWLVLLTAVFATLALSRALTEPTEIRRLPFSIQQQLQQQLQRFAGIETTQQLLSRLQQDNPQRWLVVDAQSNTVLTADLLPRDFDQNWLTELSQLSRPRWLKHHNTSLAGPFLLQIGNDQLALYQKRQRPPQPWWRLNTIPQHVLLLLTLVISAIASFILAVSISRPLRELLQRNLAFADGKLDSRVQHLVKRQDELGQLGHSFNTMAERISALLTNQQRLLRDISHELRSPLARAQLALGLTERQQNLAQMPRLKQELDRLDAMLDELLTYSRLDAGQYQLHKAPFDLPSLLAEIIAVNQVEADAKQQQLQLSAPAELIINADSHLLARAIENILRNAIKYSPANSNISCQLQLQADCCQLDICDQGPGIDECQLSAIFQPFYRLSSNREHDSGGTGLGLAIVAQIVRQHDGSVTASNQRSGGLCVRLRLPLH
ncbi:ATP-binding protein [Rheinheimera fenheensis]|uniref:ATP-binding protein n=1 Tax=Rheinheimera fenheensis TaxID=3152295 RepID=UPI00325D2F51